MFRVNTDFDCNEYELKSPLQGGYTLKEETCLAYLLYYPRTALSSCTSTTAVDFFFGAFGIKEFYDMDLMEVEKFILKESEKQ